MPSIIDKLKRFEGMSLARMQDIGGLRAVVSTVKQVPSLEDNYRTSTFKHELVSSNDYIEKPKESGYRSVHLVYRYRNQGRAAYNGLLIELQIRTQLQHAWATAVETMGTFLSQALKSSEGPDDWLSFFALTASAFSHFEDSPPVPGFEHLTREEGFKRVTEQSQAMSVKEKLLAYTIAADYVHTDNKSGAFHLITLDLKEAKVKITTYSRGNIDQASQAYTDLERRISDGEPIQAVLVSAGSVESLRRAYPNYFFDTHEFVKQLKRVEREANKTKVIVQKGADH